MKCYKINQNEIDAIAKREGNLKILLSPKACGSAHMVMGHSTLAAGEILSLHVHDYSDENFYVIRGVGTLHYVGGELSFCKGDAVHIPKGLAHQIINHAEEELEVVFCVAPLAPRPDLGHREIESLEGINHEKFN